MTKTELIAAVAAKGVDKKAAAAAVNGAIEAITDALKAGDKVAIAGLGTFEVRERAERQGKNPQTGEAITIAATKAPAFKAAKALKEAVK